MSDSLIGGADDQSNIQIDTQSPYHWKEEYWPLYRGLTIARNERELTLEENKVVEWLSFGLTKRLFEGMQ